jgi:hypothetical protein
MHCLHVGIELAAHKSENGSFSQSKTLLKAMFGKNAKAFDE